MTSEGQPVRWVRSFFLPETAQTHCGAPSRSPTRAPPTHYRADWSVPIVGQAILPAAGFQPASRYAAYCPAFTVMNPNAGVWKLPSVSVTAWSPSPKFAGTRIFN